MKLKNKEFHRKWKSPIKWAMFGLIIGAVFATVGSVGALNGWFGGGGSILSDTTTRGLVGYWGFDEGKGQIAYDSSNYSNNGSFGVNTGASTDDPSWNNGKIGGGIKLDGSADYVSVADSASLNVVDAITISAWINPSGWGDTNVGHIVAKSPDGSVNTGYAFYVSQSDTDALKFFANGGGITLFAANAISLNQWQYVTVTYDRQILKLFVNGVLKNSAAETDAISTNNSPLTIGSRATNYYFNGLIDEVRVYNRALSAEEVRYHYNRGGPVAQWKMDEGEGRTVYDSTNNNNDGTLVLAGSATSSAWVSGKYGSALSFDGVDDYVDAGNVSSNARTVSFWLKRGDTSNKDVIDLGTPEIKIASNAITSTGLTSPTYYVDAIQGNTTVAANEWRYITITDTVDISASNVDIGKASSNYFLGLIDDVRIYNYARSADEIRLDYNAGFAAKFGYTNASCQKDPASCMTQGLVGYWNFNEGSGQVAYDASDYSNSGTFGANAAASTDDPSWDKGKVGSGIKLDGSADYVSVADSDSLDFTDTVTLEAWVKPISWPIDLMRIVYKQGYSMHWRNNSTYGGFFRWADDTSDYFDSNTTLSLGTWYHIIIVRDKTAGTLKFYLNGALDKTFSGYTKAMEVNTLALGIGADANPPPSRFSNALIDDVRIYNRVLSAEEVRYHYNKGAPVLQWKMDEGEGRTVYDSTENNNDGTLVLAGSATSSAWVAGKYGSALNLDGTDDYVKSGSNFTAVSQFSHSLWFKSVDGAYSADEYLLSQGTNDPSIFVESTDSKVYVMADGSNILSSNTLVNDNKWHHAEITADGTVIKLYLDGILQSQAAYTGSSAAGLLYVGSNATPGSYFGGIVDDVRIYNYARTPDEIRLDYNAGFAAKFGYTNAGCQRDPASCVTQGLMGYWNMDEGSGTAIHDSSDYSNNGTTTNMTTPWTSGIVPLSGGKKGGSALSFDGSDDYVAIPTISISNEITAEAWVYSTNYNQSMFVVQKAPVNTQWALFFESGFLKWRGGSTDSVNCTDPADNQWHHLAVAQSGTTAKLYIDGKQCNSGAVAAIGNGTGLIDIGRHDASGYFFNGYIDEVRIYNRALSDAEVRHHYNRGGPVAQWKFDEGEGRTAYDSTENNNDGTLVLAGSATSSAWVSGKYGSALSFDGVDDYVSVTDSASLKGMSAITVETWIKPSSFPATGAIVSRWYNSVGGSDRPYILEQSGANMTWGINGQTITTADNFLSIGSWYHLVGVYDSAGTHMKTLYVNGVVKLSDTLSSGAVQSSDTINPTFGLDWVGNNHWFNGLIDDVRVYNYARTPAQVQQDYNAGLSAHFK